MATQRERFLKYLQTCVKSTRATENNPLFLSDNASKSYAAFLESERLFDYNPSKWGHVSSMYDINDYNTALWIFKELIGDEKFVKRDNENNQGWRRGAISYYLCFLKAQDFFSNKTSVASKSQSVETSCLNEILPTHDLTQKLVQVQLEMAVLVGCIKETGLIYDDVLVKRFAFSLLTKPFVILSGLAGSGKTQLAIAFASALIEDESQMCIVPVGADWTNREPLLGYPNALKEGEYVQPENKVLQLLMMANRHPQKPYFLILDEMNLSYVERYFADFLSAMESHKEISLWDKPDECECEVPSSVNLSKNLFIIGTINVDETTYMFSPKVLDRANVIEFKVSEDDMTAFLDEAPNVDVSKVEGKAANMAEDFVKMAGETVDVSKEANGVLIDFFKHLKAVNAEFGYRTATEIGRFITVSKDDFELDMAVDIAIVQKLLPKLHGSRRKIVPVLQKLWKLCLPDDNDVELDKAETVEGVKYPLTADKVLRMYRCAIDNGFTSFAEA